jgi:WD40 repeat protein
MQRTFYNHRLSELLDAMKKEVDQIQKEAALYKTYRDELEKKLSIQLNEMNAFKQSLFELERVHLQIKAQYEDEIFRLKELLDPKKKQKLDWFVTSNPNIDTLQRSGINIEMLHSLDHDSVVCCCKFSPDGNYLATGCNHYAQIFDVSTGRRIWSPFLT